ncbi:hypothetical protein CPB86DRAFT_305568 [Serendipita vermifera]|nr:hypothetical protein CPB86DRAFT_305568 [Serendipita vermifera]
MAYVPVTARSSDEPNQYQTLNQNQYQPSQYQPNQYHTLYAASQQAPWTPNTNVDSPQGVPNPSHTLYPTASTDTLAPPITTKPRRKATWEYKIHGKWTRVLYGGLGTALVGVWIFIMVCFAREESDYQSDNVDGVRDVLHSTNSNVFDIYWVLEGSLTKFDPDARALSVNWAPRWIQNSVMSPFGTTPNSTLGIGIYRDQSLIPIDAAGLPVNYTLPDQTIADWRVANASAVPIAVVGTTPFDSFDTQIDLSQRTAKTALRQPGFGFPFDLWAGSITFVANYYEVAKAGNASTSLGIEIDDAFFVDSIMNWRITLSTVNSCATSFPNGTLRWTATKPCQLTVNIKARRTGLVKFASIVAVVVNWLSTIFIFVMTCEGVIMRRFHVIEGPQLLAVCFTALFALPSVRSLLPGAPQFGALIDLVGIIPNVIIISLCTCMVAIATLRAIHDREVRSRIEHPKVE